MSVLLCVRCCQRSVEKRKMISKCFSSTPQLPCASGTSYSKLDGARRVEAIYYEALLVVQLLATQS